MCSVINRRGFTEVINVFELFKAEKIYILYVCIVFDGGERSSGEGCVGGSHQDQ